IRPRPSTKAPAASTTPQISRADSPSGRFTVTNKTFSRILLLSFCSLGVIGAAPGVLGASAPDYQINVLSSRPDMVTGGDALVQVNGPAKSTGSVLIELNGQDVTSAF